MPPLTPSDTPALARRRVDYYRHRAEHAETEEDRDKWFALRRQSNGELIDLEDAAGLRNVPARSVSEIIAGPAPDGTGIPQPAGRLIRNVTQVAIGGPIVMVRGRARVPRDVESAGEEELHGRAG